MKELISLTKLLNSAEMEHEFYGVIATAAGFTKYLVGGVY